MTKPDEFNIKPCNKIDPECIKRIFEAIHEESVNQQVQVMNRN